MSRAHVQELPVPHPESNTSDAFLLVRGDLGFVFYCAAPATAEPLRGWYCIELVECSFVQAGTPNDEGQSKHRFSSVGLQPYSVQEVVGSPWPQEHADQCFVGGPAPRTDARHFIVALKEATIECIAGGYRLHGPFQNSVEALRMAVQRISPPHLFDWKK